MTLTDLIFQKCADPKRICVIEGANSFTYQDLFNKISAIGAFLKSEIKKGERVGILHQNGMEFISSYLAVFHSGAVAIPINTATYSTDLKCVVDDCGIKIILSSEKFFDKIDFQNKFLTSEILKNKKAFDSFVASNAANNDLASLVYTSGSTGKPTAVCVTHSNLMANTASIIEYLALSKTDKIMVVLPFYYCFGASLMHTTLVTSGTLVINNNFRFPQKVVDEMIEKRCTVFAGVPSTYKIIMNKTRLPKVGIKTLRYALQAGGRLSPDEIIRLDEALPGTEIIIMYGQTEATARLSYLPPNLLRKKLGSIGKGIPGVELEVVDKNDNKVEAGSIGEIRARGANITQGYWNRPQETKAKFRNGWLYTGDMAKVDEEGFIYIVGRNEDFIKSGGVRFSAIEVEDMISSIAGVEAVAVLGVPDEILEEALHAFVVLKDKNITKKDIINLCKKSLPSYKIPKYVSLIDELPLNAFGKVQKSDLVKSARGTHV